jgi:porphyrinogen peroxidase
MDGSSFVAVQQWSHDFNAFDAMNEKEQDDAIGRHVKDNEEFDEAPESAHVKRSAQEQFDPEAFMLRRSMPWVDGMDSGLMFVAFGHSFHAFETIMDHMIGKNDNIVDALFEFSKPINGAYLWCPPVKNGKLDLSITG